MLAELKAKFNEVGCCKCLARGGRNHPRGGNILGRKSDLGMAEWYSGWCSKYGSCRAMESFEGESTTGTTERCLGKMLCWQVISSISGGLDEVGHVSRSWRRPKIDHYRYPSASSFWILEGEGVERTDLSPGLGSVAVCTLKGSSWYASSYCKRFWKFGVGEDSWLINDQIPGVIVNEIVCQGRIISG